MERQRQIYRVQFISQDKLCELFACEVGQSAIDGFIELGDIIFGERSAVVIDPSEEQVKREFAGVKRTYIPIHAIVRIDEVEREGINIGPKL